MYILLMSCFVYLVTCMPSFLGDVLCCVGCCYFSFLGGMHLRPVEWSRCALFPTRCSGSWSRTWDHFLAFFCVSVCLFLCCVVLFVFRFVSHVWVGPLLCFFCCLHLLDFCNLVSLGFFGLVGFFSIPHVLARCMGLRHDVTQMCPIESGVFFFIAC